MPEMTQIFILSMVKQGNLITLRASLHLKFTSFLIKCFNVASPINFLVIK